MAGRVVVLLSVILLWNCGGRQSVQKENSLPQVSLGEFPLRFDGLPRPGWDVTNFGPQGPVSISGNEIILGMGDGCTGITWRSEFPVDNYTVDLDAKRMQGNDFFCGLTFPVGKAPCTLIVGGWGGTTVGLSSVDGLDASDNFTRKLMQFDNNRWYHIRLTVKAGRISAWIDNIQVIDLDAGPHKLSVRPEVELSRPFGIAAWNTTAAIRDVRVMNLNR